MDYRIIIVSIIVMILIGTLSKKIGLLKENDVETLNNIVINIALPCMIFNALYTADVSLLPRLSILTVYMLITSFSNTLSWKDYSPPMCIPGTLDKDQQTTCVGVFLWALFCSTDLYLRFYTDSILFLLSQLCNIFWTRKYDAAKPQKVITSLLFLFSC